MTITFGCCNQKASVPASDATHVQTTILITINLYSVTLNKCSLFGYKHNGMASIETAVAIFGQRVKGKVR